MWNTWIDNAKKVAEKAKAAAEQLEGQLNESVGAKQKHQSAVTSASVLSSTSFQGGDALVSEDVLVENDSFYDDDNGTGGTSIAAKSNDYYGVQAAALNHGLGNTKKHEEEESALSGGLAAETPVSKIHLMPSTDSADVTLDGWANEDNLDDIMLDDHIVRNEYPATTLAEASDKNVALSSTRLQDETPADEQQYNQTIISEKPETLHAVTLELSDLPQTEGKRPVSQISEERQNYAENHDAFYAESGVQDDENANVWQQKDSIRTEESIQSAAFTARSEIKAGGDTAFSELEPPLLPSIDATTASPLAVKKSHFLNNDGMQSPTLSTPALKPPLLPDAVAKPLFVPASPNDDNVSERNLQLQEEHELATALLQSQIFSLQSELNHREQQLASKATQLASLQESHQNEKDVLRQNVRDIKDEAKKRILKAKDEMQSRLTDAVVRADTLQFELERNESIIKALRTEGETLARKQSEMEKKDRETRIEMKGLKYDIVAETEGREAAELKVKELEGQLNTVKEELDNARHGETRADKLDADLTSEREEKERNAAVILSLKEEVKELKEENEELRLVMEEVRKEAVLENQRDSDKLKKENCDLLKDWETKLRACEREANLREDALRHEVGELRKRWQDSVRRIDSLGMDLQQSSAPLMRQLESTERQSRARAAAWAELEAKLRSDLEDQVIQNEKLFKENTEINTTLKRLERALAEKSDEIVLAQVTIDNSAAKLVNMEAEIEKMEIASKKLKEERIEIERQSNARDVKVRKEMMKAVRDSEQHYQMQIETLERSLKTEVEKRLVFENRLETLVQGVGGALPDSTNEVSTTKVVKQTLRSSETQADILQSTLLGLNNSDDENDEVYTLPDKDDNELEGAAGSSYAFMEQLLQGSKAARMEIESLRHQLAELEETRERLVKELGECQGAREQLPILEAKVAELTREVYEKDLDIRGLRDDISDVRTMYRSQLDALLEEKALTATTFNELNNTTGEGEETFSTASDSLAATFDMAYEGL